MNRLADLCDAHADELARLETLQTGTAYKLRRESDFAFASDNLRFFAGQIRHLEGKAAYEYSGSHTSMVRREPIGVVAQVAPWNYPFWMAIWKIGRPSPRATRSSSSRPARPRSPRSGWPSWPPRPACRPASSTWSPAGAMSSARRWPPTWTSISSR